MSAYRAGHGSAPAPEGREDGLVDELIGQFADPLAFFRELIQNAIDADATQIAVTLAFDVDPSEETDPLGTLEVSVRDDGRGMSQEILEDQLTVLFRSGKEGRADKIGKFGVGFVSVLAVEPELVSVRTTEGEGALFTLELRGDQTFDLFRSEGGGSSGTTVTLRLRKRRSEFEPFVSGSERALRKWCRHAEIPIRFVASSVSGEVLREARIDTPLGLEALVSVRVTDGGTTVVAGLPPDGQPHLAFFNRGLLLHETSKDVFGRVMLSIQDGRLEHTLSRDNVRRDDHYVRATRIARRVIDRELLREVHDVLRELATGRRVEPPIEAVLVAARNAGLALDQAAVCVPLLEPLSGRATTLRLADLSGRQVYVERGRDELTAAVAARGVAIVDLSVAVHREAYRAVLDAYAGRELVRVHDELTLAAPVEETAADLLLMSRTGDLVAELVRRPNGPTLARLLGARESALQLCGGSGALPLALDADAASADPFRLLARPAWLLNAEHPAVLAARRLAVSEPALAASVLTRILLLDRGRLDEGEDEAWLSAASEALER